MKISDDQTKKIEQKIHEVEKLTSGEIIPILLKQSDFYPAAHFRSAIVIGILSVLIFSFIQEEPYNPLWLLWIQFAGFIVGYFLAYLPSCKKLFSKKDEMDEEVYQKGLQLFFENNLHTTKDRTGILVMVSLLEHKIEILADEGINKKVEKDTWSNLLIPFPEMVKKGDFVEGLIEIIDKCGKILEEKFPIKDGDTNELPNKLIND